MSTMWWTLGGGPQWLAMREGGWDFVNASDVDG